MIIIISGEIDNCLHRYMSATTPDPQDAPKDAKLVSLLLQALDVEEYEPRVIPQLLDFAYRIFCASEFWMTLF